MELERTTLLNDGKKELSVAELTRAVADPNIKVIGFLVHKKASEKYVVVSIESSGISCEWVIPYLYRRTGTIIDDEKGLVALIWKSKQCLTVDNIVAYKARMRPRLKSLFGSGATVTIPIFRKLLSKCGRWVCNKEFKNENPQRRIQDIKEKGFTLATKIERRATFHMLLPFEPVQAFTYEKIPARIRRKIFVVHTGIDAYTGNQAKVSCLPDHKFPEIRWDKNTPESNEGLTEQEMLEKFQIIPERVNQAKREVCRRCFQTGLRGKLNGINFFYQGSELWDSSIPKMGKEAEVGCVGCFWYDMLAWRKALHEKLGVDR